MKKYLVTAFVSAGILFSMNSGQASAHENHYNAQAGDFLWKIATENQVSVNDLITWNNLTSTTIYVGQDLSLLPPHTHEIYKSYTVKSGDTLYLIAKANHTTVVDLKSINQLSSDLINIGQVLKISTNSLAEQETTTNQTASTYTVKSGDSLWKIATNHHVTISELKAYNNLTSDVIMVGQVLRLTPPTGVSITNEENHVIPFQVDALISEAKKYLGVPYVWAGTTPSGFDCSGFLDYVYNTQNIALPRTVESIWSATKPAATPQKGDLVFFETYTNGPSHAGIYLGNNQFIHASSSQGVTISDMNNVYWKPRYLGVKRVY